MGTEDLDWIPEIDTESYFGEKAWGNYKGMKIGALLNCTWDLSTVNYFMHFFLLGAQQMLWRLEEVGIISKGDSLQFGKEIDKAYKKV